MNRNKIYNRRKMWVLFLCITICCVVLLCRVIYLMVFQREYYSKKAVELQNRERTISASRGNIVDRNGVVLASNELVYNISVIHNQITDEQKVVDELSKLLDIDEAEVKKRVQKVSSIEKIKNNVSKEIGEKILALNLDGVKVDAGYKRVYPYKDLAAKVIGFTGGDNQGIIGLEAVYDEYLKGDDGIIYSVTDARGVEVKNQAETRKEPVAGDDLHLTLDYNLQCYLMQAAEKTYIQKEADAVEIIAMNPQNGEILGMVDYPEFDLSKPFELSEGIDDVNQMWRNRCISDTYEPGSTFKVITTTAALEEKLVSLEERFYCPGYITVEDRRIRCHKTTGHGSQSFVEAIENSCNPVFIDIGLRIGADRFYDYFNKLGLMDKTGIDLPGEAKTIMHQKENIGQVELATISFGQSFQVTPIQLMTTIASIVNGGNRITPHLCSYIQSAEGDVVKEYKASSTKQICSEKTSETVRFLLEKVVSEGGGNKAYIEGYNIGGKTATSQTLPRSDNKYISSFLGFAPADDPQIMVLVIINNPKGAYYGGVIAAPVAKEIFENVLPYAILKSNETEE
ncbi:MAG: penicillin-binding transpeptidase domain-containing protein [Agathobacter sp.]|nr:penicillin-binding transpeptidase domain-containing protein [Agathobacter sp.]MDY3796208.1 penicillin-binding transpeptidase domain-containing protein [Agathobacter sp.]